jgi:predicted MPP superfamily phosphohydrolase
MVPPVVIRYDDIAQLANRYDDLTAGLKKVLVMSVGEWYIETKDKKAELLKIKKQ